MEAQTTELFLGEALDDSGARNSRPIIVDPAHLTTHGVIVGMTGSGKTGLGIILLEEALLRGIPVLVLDPKGDMENLLLNFPSLRPKDYRPWIDLEEELADELSTIREKWETTAGEIESRTIPLEKSDVSVEEVVLVWIPS